ncbi:MAG: hypothetical protein RSD41_04780 [Kiritimatiellia bacterium]
MIRKVCYFLFALLALMVVAKMIKGCTSAVKPVAMKTALAVAEVKTGNALRLYYEVWPPFIAENPMTNRNGYCLDIIRQIFPQVTFISEERGMKVMIETLRDQAQGATVNYGQHPNLKEFPHSRTPIVFYTLGIYTLRSNPWVYSGEASLDHLRLGYSSDYLESTFVANHWKRYQKDAQHVMRFDDENSSSFDWANMVIAGKLDAFILTIDSRTWANANSNLELIDTFRSSGPVDHVPLFLTVSGKDPVFAEQVLKEFEAGMLRLREDGTLARLRQYYGISEMEELK